jgi:hypothetical protein
MRQIKLFQFAYSFQPHTALEFTQHLTEMSMQNVSGEQSAASA